jgi:hypothetical protein
MRKGITYWYRLQTAFVITPGVLIFKPAWVAMNLPAFSHEQVGMRVKLWLENSIMNLTNFLTAMNGRLHPVLGL